jgi:hypothetical protein
MLVDDCPFYAHLIPKFIHYDGDAAAVLCCQDVPH